jgi:hypothetical protein
MYLILSNLLLILLGLAALEATIAFSPFSPSSCSLSKQRILSQSSNSNSNRHTNNLQALVDPQAVETVAAVAEQFKLITCMSTGCSQKRKILGMDELATFGAFYARRADANAMTAVQLEEGPCLGACKKGPCVAIQHDDFEGNVGLEGMTDDELSERV